MTPPSPLKSLLFCKPTQCSTWESLPMLILEDMPPTCTGYDDDDEEGEDGTDLDDEEAMLASC